MGKHPKPGQRIALVVEKAICKYGTGPFVVIKCTDGSGDIWFEDDLPYYDLDDKPIQSRCSATECITLL